MKKRNINFLKPIVIAVIITIFASCQQETPPTKSQMEGVWQATNVYNDQGADITSRVKFPVVAFSLSSDNTIVSTAGPLFMYVVYGDSKYTQIAADIDQIFDYTKLSFNGGEFFVAGGVVDRFTIEMKLEGLPGQHALTELLNLLGIAQDYLDVVIYHKFMNVKVTFDATGQQMTWVIDDQTTATYNTKDQYGNYVLWQGWPVNNFSHCTIVLKKCTNTIQDVVKQNS
jgi:hypothetical protein